MVEQQGPYIQGLGVQVVQVAQQDLRAISQIGQVEQVELRHLLGVVLGVVPWACGLRALRQLRNLVLVTMVIR
tara:strand:- start:29 stop:247 length:219 start_codon:yes stop_codon:yes gene_type:complete